MATPNRANVPYLATLCPIFGDIVSQTSPYCAPYSAGSREHSAADLISPRPSCVPRATRTRDPN
eukprot:610406-Prymnesium_polylepis.2